MAARQAWATCAGLDDGDKERGRLSSGPLPLSKCCTAARKGDPEALTCPPLAGGPGVHRGRGPPPSPRGSSDPCEESISQDGDRQGLHRQAARSFQRSHPIRQGRNRQVLSRDSENEGRGGGAPVQGAEPPPLAAPCPRPISFLRSATSIRLPNAPIFPPCPSHRRLRQSCRHLPPPFLPAASPNLSLAILS